MRRHATAMIVLLASLAGTAHAQYDARAQQQQAARQQQQEQMRRQQEDMRRQQQEQMRQQMQQQQRQQMQQQMQQQQREQMQQQQREQARQQQQEMQRQQRQQQSAQSRQQAQDAQRQAQQSQQRQAQQSAAQSQRANAAALNDRRTFSNGVTKSNLPPTNAQLAKGYTGKHAPDGRALVKFNDRILAVPSSRIGIKPRQAANDRGGASTATASTWSPQKQSAVRADMQKLAGAAGGGAAGKGRSSDGPGGPGAGLSKTFNAAARQRSEAARAVRMGQGAQMAGVVRGNSREENLKYVTEKAVKEGWKPPHSTGSGLRSYVSQRTERFVRVHTEGRAKGSFMVREKQIAHLGNDPAKIRQYLGLKDTPTHITDVDVPPNTPMQVSVIGAQENFKKDSAEGFQYITMDELPDSAFKNTRDLR